MKDSRGFTLIELLAVIVIMGILMAVAIPSINLIIMDARKDIYVNSARTFINEAEKEVVNSTFEIDDPDTTYYIHIANLVDDATNLGKSGFATWSDSYVVATMNLVNNKVNTNYYFNSSDMAKWKITLVGRDSLKKSDVYQDTNKKVTNKARTGIKSLLTESGLINIINPRIRKIPKNENKVIFFILLE